MDNGNDDFDDIYGDDIFWNSPETHSALDQLERLAYMSEPVASDGQVLSNESSPPYVEPTSSTAACEQTHAPASDVDAALSAPDAAEKRGRGRPKGSRNKPKEGSADNEPVLEPVRRKPGRPPGTGPRQRARALALIQPDLASVPTEIKRRPGRPKKYSTEGSVSVELGRFLIPGNGTQRGQQAIPASDNSNTTPSPTSPSPHPTTPPVILLEAIRDLSDPPLSPPLPEINNDAVVDAQISEVAPTRVCDADYENGQAVDLARSEIHILPDEDSQCAVELVSDQDDEDEYAGFIDSDGIGATNDEVGQFDEDSDDEEDPAASALNEENSQSPAPGRIRRPLPKWLSSEFQTKVSESNMRGPDGLPPLYRDHETFWFPRKSIFFLLRPSIPRPEQLYNPSFFLWDPMALCSEGIRCPNCKTKLHRHGHIPYPRRCVDQTDSFWLIGYRYKCPECRHPKSGKRTVTFRSYDSRILAAIPRELSLEFPASLTHRRGLSKHTFAMMRSCFQNGMGPKQFSDSLRVQHLQHHDNVNLQYLHAIVRRKSMAEWQGEKFEPLLPYDDNSEKGRHGFSPGMEWLRDVYDQDAEKHSNVLNQHMSMLSAEVCSSDHSHKITKHVAKVNGVKIFEGLFTITNEKGEIRVCNLVGSKSHDSFRYALEQMRLSLDMYGHSQPKVFYTDNMADKQFLEELFPSLRENITPVEKYAHLEPFIIPPQIQVQVKTTPATIDDDMRKILDTLPDDGSAGQIVVGFDSEWNVEASSYGGIVSRGRTAIVQIAHENTIYILQVGQLLASKKLPRHLKLLLLNPNVLKVGRLVNTDLRFLQMVCDESEPFVGGLDLAKLAKERNLISTAKCSLSDLCAAVLHKRLDKNVPERISNQWENEELTKEQIDYAARDAYVSLALFRAISRIPAPQPLPPHPKPGLRVQIYHDDNTRLIAYGQISGHCEDREYDGVQVLHTRTVVEVTEVLVPGAILGLYKKKALSAFGVTPFNLVVIRSHLRVSEATPISCHSRGSAEGLPTPPLQISDTSIIDNAETGGDLDVDDFSSITDIMFSDAQETTPQVSEIHIADPISIEEGNQILEPVPSEWPTLIRSRVLKDIFHVFKMFYIHRAHGLRFEFARALRDAIFLVDKEDRQRIDAWGARQQPPVSFNSLKQSSPKFLWKHCRRIVPPPELLYPIVDNVFRTFGPLKDAQTGRPLFDTNNWKVAKNILALIRDGYISDPPGISLYTQIGIDAKAGGLPIYRCSRGTNQTEGSVHTHLRPRLPTSGASVRHVNACLLDFILRHNLLVGTFNSTGKRYRGHFDIWITNELQELYTYLQDLLIDAPVLTGWVNGNLYVPTMEVAGVLPVPHHVREMSGMEAYEPSLDSPTKFCQPHQFLASLQGTRKPVLPVHSTLEKELFRKLLSEHKAFNSPTSGPDWKQAVKVWNRHANDTKGIFYKLVEHLTMYFTHWKTNVNVKESLSLSARARVPLNAVILDPKRTLHAPSNIPVRPLLPNQVTTGFRALSEEPGPPIQSASSSSLSGTPLDDTLVAAQLSRKRVSTALEDTRPKKKQRSRRHCGKCGSESCNGKQQVSRCLSRCRDCGKVSCRGRDTKRPNVACYNRDP